jgi:hypothetical protein
VKLALESTDKIVQIRVGEAIVPARIWQGQTESGIPVHCYVTRVAVANGLPTEEFERELREHAPMRPDVAGIPTRLVL